MVNRAGVRSFYRSFQDRFSEMLGGVDPSASVTDDPWDRAGGGGGLTRVFSNGDHIEKAAVNFSDVEGATPPALSEGLAHGSDRFAATGISIIVHPTNPFAPTFHANLRFFEVTPGTPWFGGGTDLTPHYLFVDDAVAFHRTLRDVCANHQVADYAAWKKTCDEYFYLPHRREARGVGGIFFDHLVHDLDAVFAFQKQLGAGFLGVYQTILGRRIGLPYDESHRSWQAIRRGRYAEFNLAIDRGTRFGLETGGRTESILASLPPLAAWAYDYEPPPESPEHELVKVLRAGPRDWL